MIAVVLTWWIYLIDKSVLVKLVGITVPLVLVGRLVAAKVAARRPLPGVRPGHDHRRRRFGRDLAAAMDQNPDCGLPSVSSTGSRSACRTR